LESEVGLGIDAIQSTHPYHAFGVSVAVCDLTLLSRSLRCGQGRLDKAKKYYKKGGDFRSLVRLCCFESDFTKAAEIVSDSGDRAAAYYFAQQMEQQGQFMDAVNFFADAGCYNHAIRLTRAYNLDAEIMRFAVRATPSLMLDCATYFESKGEYEKAVQLLHKGGDLPRAMDLCFRAGEKMQKLPPGASRQAQADAQAKASGLFEMLNTIAQELGADTSPQTLARCAEFLVRHKQFTRAIELYVMAKRYQQAIEMCEKHKVVITDEMVEQLTPAEGALDAGERKEILKDLGHALKKQGGSSCDAIGQRMKPRRLPHRPCFHPAASSASSSHLFQLSLSLPPPAPSPSLSLLSLPPSTRPISLAPLGAFVLASKKYTQAGDRVRAMKCLVRGGDTKAVIQFANISRNAEIYKLAANYLQQMNWRESVDIMKVLTLWCFFFVCVQPALSWHSFSREITGFCSPTFLPGRPVCTGHHHVLHQGPGLRATRGVLRLVRAGAFLSRPNLGPYVGPYVGPYLGPI